LAYSINDNCTSCGSCVDECSFSCITKGDGKYVIDEAECASCGACAGVCESNAIVEG
jgi:MinD superfamily P-loop ATPase